jgi:hypothetical protein
MSELSNEKQMIDKLLDRARRRLVRNRLLYQLSLAGACVAGSIAVLLIVGTQILEWWVPVTLGVLTFGAGMAWVFVKAPRFEAVARILDRRCGLADAVATALHFRGSTQELAEAQRLQAESAAASVDLEWALPFRTPRPVYALAGLAAIAAALLVFRYGTEPKLDLRAPMAVIRMDPLAMAARADEKSGQRKNAKTDPAPTDLMSRLGDSTADNPMAQALQNQPESAVSTEANDSRDGGRAQLAEGNKETGDSEESSGAESSAGAPKGAADQPSSRDGAPQSAQAGGKSPGSSDGASGLMSRVRDAVSSLMSKMKPSGGQPPPTGRQANGKQAGGNQQSGQKSGQQGQQGQGNQSQQEGNESAAAESEQMAPGQGAGKGSDQNATAKPGSGMGRQDGSKELKDAEQLAAMGKLSEIIGKRSATVTGEMTIEPQSGPQQLRTGYTRSSAKHGESGGDVSRDEVPVAMQSYVQQYFEQVRKQGVKTARTGKAETRP